MNGLPDIRPPASSKYEEPFDSVPDIFCLPENDEFAGYWDRAQDCLYKIRHCMNSKGVIRPLALFEPPIDPRQLIRDLAAGQRLENPGTSPTPAVPHYRFAVVLQQAKSLTATVIQLGSALLTALEKKDGEDLNLLRSMQEQAILNMTRSIKEKQIEDGAKHLESLGHSLEAAKQREEHYGSLLANAPSLEEKQNENLMIAALAFHTASPVFYLSSLGPYLLPNVFGMADGGNQWGKAVEVGGRVSDASAAVLNQGAQLAAVKAQNQRRQEDWQHQVKLATCDVSQIQAEIDGAEIRQKIMERDLEIHDKSTEQARERDAFYRNKFGTSDLYQWMSGRLATVYFQAYKLALDLARSAERAYKFERNTDQATIAVGSWDSLRKGLFAGEALMLGLNQLEKSYMDDDERALEIEKTISLRQPLDPASSSASWSEFTKDGKLEFKLDEKLFDNDFPGHYCRKIKSIAITIPAVVGPYQNVLATLRQTTNRVLLTKDVKGVDFLLGRPDGAPISIRTDWRAQQQIAISKGVNDSGLFELNFRDERYLPFEGTGVVSDWVFEMPPASNSKAILDSVSDVIIHLRYTARDGGPDFRKEVSERLEAGRG